MKLLSEANIAKQQAFINCFVETKRLTGILNDFERLRENSLLGGEQLCMLITGDTGTGKSYLINYYKTQSELSLPSHSRDCPVLVTRIPSRVDLNGMMRQMLIDLKMFSADRRRGSAKYYDVGIAEFLIRSLKERNVELVIVNEFQELIEFKSFKERQDIANRLKQISEDACVPIVLVGMPWAKKIAEEPQWSSRLMCRRELRYFSLSENPVEYAGFLKKLSRHMPFHARPKLEKPEWCFPLYAASKGVLRELKHLLNEACKQALKSGDDSFKLSHLQSAYESLSPEETNPFTLKLEQLKISEVEQLSKFNPDAYDKEEALTAPVFSKAIPLHELLKKRN